MSARFVFDTSVYVAVFRDARFAAALRERYARELPRTHLSSVVVQELATGALTARHRRQAAALYEPFERIGRIVTPTHGVWKEAGAVLATLAVRFPGWRVRPFDLEVLPGKARLGAR